MSRPQLIEWLERETGRVLDRPDASAPKSRHVSIRVPDELFAQLEIAAARRGETVSQAARRILLAGLASPAEPQDAIDAAIASLLEARDRLARRPTGKA
jgi:plasmid stability protein